MTFVSDHIGLAKSLAWNYARKYSIKNPVDVEDAVQEALAGLCRVAKYVAGKDLDPKHLTRLAALGVKSELKNWRKTVYYKHKDLVGAELLGTVDRPGLRRTASDPIWFSDETPPDRKIFLDQLRRFLTDRQYQELFSEEKIGTRQARADARRRGLARLKKEGIC